MARDHTRPLLNQSLLRHAFRERSSRGERKPRPETPHGCRPAFHSEHAGAGIDSSRRRSVQRPTAIGPVRYRARCCASLAKARCAGRANLGGLPPHHNLGLLTRNQGDGAEILACPVRMGWHQPVRVLVASHYGWPRSAESPAELPVRRKSDDACCRVWLGR